MTNTRLSPIWICRGQRPAILDHVWISSKAIVRPTIRGVSTIDAGSIVAKDFPYFVLLRAILKWSAG
jgi:hypothetical protein